MGRSQFLAIELLSDFGYQTPKPDIFGHQTTKTRQLWTSTGFIFGFRRDWCRSRGACDEDNNERSLWTRKTKRNANQQLVRDKTLIDGFGKGSRMANHHDWQHEL